MARSTYIYLAYSDETLLGAFTVKRELFEAVGALDQPLRRDPFEWTELTNGIHVQRLKDGELRR